MDVIDTIYLSIKTQKIIQDYLDGLAEIGLYGGTREEVTEYLIRLELLRLVKEGFINLKVKGN